MSVRIVTTSCVFPRGYPAQTMVERLARLGFDGIDMGLDYCTAADHPFMGPDFLSWAESLRRKAQSLGVAITHSHSPGGADCGEIVTRAIETAATLGAGYMVLHPATRFPDGNEIRDADDFIEFNAEAVLPRLKEARRHGVIILSENLPDGPSGDPRVIDALVNKVGSEWFGWCYDTGHAHCLGYPPDVLRECRAAPLSLHMQDNHPEEGDEHLIPGDGTIDWPALIGILREIGYKGDCVLEAHTQSKKAPDAERDAILTRLMTKAKELKSLMEK